MTPFPRSGLGRGPATDRVLVLLRGEPGALHVALQVEPAPEADGLLLAVFSRRGRVGRFLARDRLAWFVGDRELTGDTRPQTEIRQSDRFTLDMTVTARDAGRLALRAEACAHPEGSTFQGARQACEYFDRFRATRAEPRRMWEPLAPLSLEWQLPPHLSELRGHLRFDSAFRQVPTRVLPTPGTALRALRTRRAPRALPAP